MWSCYIFNFPKNCKVFIAQRLFGLKRQSRSTIFAEALLHAPNSLSQADRELIATYVSYLNDCYFCQTVHDEFDT